MKSFSRSAGFSLLEALVALVILATGLLAVARFQSALVTSSASSKARAEALALAQQKIDEIRSYDDLEAMISVINPDMTYTSDMTFDDVVDDTQVPDTSQSLTGVNADFTRYWEIDNTGSSADVNVVVTWSDPNSGCCDGEGNAFTESVTLSTQVTYHTPGLSGELALIESDPIIPNTTGRSFLGGDQTYTSDELDTLDSEGKLEHNDDGTASYKDADNNQVELIDIDSGDVLITLEEACNVTDGGQPVCTDFVKVSGYVWIDIASIGSSKAPDADTIFVLASDNAICTMKNASDEIINIDGDYEYFPYRCYLGGGWSGNLGIIQTDSDNDVCVGDPDSSVNEVILAKRRVYRGMLSRDEYSGTGTGTAGADLATDDVDSDGVEEFDAIGVADALEMPNKNNDSINADYLAGNYDPWGNLYLPGHNYMLTNFTGGAPSDSDCAEKLKPSGTNKVKITLYDSADTDTRTEVTTVDAFADTRDEFVCLNQVYDYETTDGGSTVDAKQLYFDAIDDRIEDGYLAENNDQIIYTEDVDDSDVIYYKVASTQANDSGAISSTNIINTSSEHVLIQNECPYNPAENVTQRSYVYGSLYWEANSDGFTPSSVVEGMVVNTSDDISEGVANSCEVTTRAAVGSASRGDGTTDGSPDAAVFADYACRVYHTYDVGTGEGTGWDGIVSIYPATNYSCDDNGTPSASSYYSRSASAITEDTGDQTGASGDLDFVCSFSGVTGSDLVTTIEQVQNGSSVLDTSPTEGSTVRFEVKVLNNGPADNPNVTVSIPTPSGLTYSSSSAASSDANSAGTFSSESWSISSIASGVTKTLTLNYTVDSGLVNSGSNLPSSPITFTIAAATGDESDANIAGDSLSVELIPTTSGTANLVTVKNITSTTGALAAGAAVEYEITVTNLGGGNVSNISLTETWPSLLNDPDDPPTITSDNSTPGTYSHPTWSGFNLNAEESATLTLTTTVKSSGSAGTIENTVSAASSASLVDPSDINDSLTDSSISKTGASAIDLLTTVSVDDSSVSDGDMATFTITIANGSSSTAINSVSTTFDLKNTAAFNGLTLLTSGSTSGSQITSTTSTDCSSDANFDCTTGVWSGFNISANSSASLTLKAGVGSAFSSNAPFDVSTTAPTGNKTDADTTDDTLSVEMTEAVASVTYTPAEIDGSLIQNPSTGSGRARGKISSMKIQLVDHSNQLTGSLTNCSVPGSKTSYSCSINFDSASHKGAVLLWTSDDNDDPPCFNAKLNGSTLETTTYANGTYYWIGSIDGQATTQDVVIANTVGECIAP